MIDIYLNGVQTTVEKIKHFMGSPAGIFLYVCVTGAVGIIILLVFLSMFISPAALPMALPVIIAFNCAAGGYNLTNKNALETPPGKITLGLTALVLTVTGCGAIVFFCPWEPIFDPARCLIAATAALIFTVFGAWIAYKSKSLNRS
ncbi:MAG: hypothetical protein COA36_14335 [Desulfotalea sp.]|nr:MAG: hypothetical protein COA36_14335 [Desulfotalea sp.]